MNKLRRNINSVNTQRIILLCCVVVHPTSLWRNTAGIIYVFLGVLKKDFGKFTKMGNSLILTDGLALNK